MRLKIEGALASGQVPKLEAAVKRAGDGTHALPVRRHRQDGVGASGIEVPHEFAIPHVPKSDTAVARSGQREFHARVPGPNGEVHCGPSRRNAVVLQRRVVRQRLGPPKEVLRSDRNAQARLQPALDRADLLVQAGAHARQRSAAHVPHDDLGLPLGEAHKALCLTLDRRGARRRGGHETAGDLVVLLDVCGQVPGLHRSRLLELTRDEAVRVVRPLLQQQLEEGVHELVHSVPVEIGPRLRFGIPLPRLRVSQSCPRLGLRPRAVPLRVEDLQGHAHLATVRGLQGNHTSAFTIELSEARAGAASPEEREHVNPQRPWPSGKPKRRGAWQRTLTARRPGAHGEDAALRQADGV
mmetsp:Transcript_64686/g.186028  ORF Transcript_64686/g.186028 Transcript_64686/m.186028 type:complete len:354 (+) Transcript_64686:878-1939(+)